MLKARILPVTPLRQNCTFLWCAETRRAAVVDPGGEVGHILAALDKLKLSVERILLTHGHIDHVGGAVELSQALGIPIEGPQREDAFLVEGDHFERQCEMFGLPPQSGFTPARWLEDGDTIAFGNQTLQVIHAPGHTPATSSISTRAQSLRRWAMCCSPAPSAAPISRAATSTPSSIPSAKNSFRWATRSNSSPATAPPPPSETSAPAIPGWAMGASDPAPRGGQLSDMALTAVLRRMERGGFTQHGFRSTFRDWAGETTTYPREVCEHALAYKLADGVEAAYQRGDLLAKRARLMVVGRGTAALFKAMPKTVQHSSECRLSIRRNNTPCHNRLFVNDFLLVSTTFACAIALPCAGRLF